MGQKSRSWDYDRFSMGEPENLICDLHSETGHFMKVRITKLNGRENLQTNLRINAIGKRSCNTVEKHQLDLLTMGMPLECTGKLNLLKAQFCAFNASDSTTTPLTVQK